MSKENIAKAIEELRKNEKRKFNQSIDLIINLKNFDIKRDSVNIVVNLPHKIKELKVGAFLNKESSLVDTITKADFAKYRDKKDIKKLVRQYDLFIAHGKLMPEIATSFGKYLGPVGKMPTPALGIIMNDDENSIKEILKKIDKIVKVKTKEPSIKLCVGKEEMKDNEIADNIQAVYDAVANALPRKKENVKNIMIKFTMSKPVKLTL